MVSPITPPRASMKLRGIRWYIAGLLFLSSVINYIDRQTLSVVAPSLTKELHMTPMEYSNVLQAFLVAYTLMYLGSGFLVDRWGTRASLAASWRSGRSATCCMPSRERRSSWESSARCSASANRATSWPGFKAISEWYPAKEKAFVNGLLNGGSAVGAIIARPVGGVADGLLQLANGVRRHRRAGLRLAGGMADVLPICRSSIPGSRRRNWRWCTTGTGTRPNRSTAPSLRLTQLLRKRQTWGLLVSRFISDPVWWFYLFWLPKYLVDSGISRWCIWECSRGFRISRPISAPSAAASPPDGWSNADGSRCARERPCCCPARFSCRSAC